MPQLLAAAATAISSWFLPAAGSAAAAAGAAAGAAAPGLLAIPAIGAGTGLAGAATAGMGAAGLGAAGLAGAGAGLGSMAKSLAMPAASIGTSMYSAKKQEKGMEAARAQNEALYNKYSLPSAQVVQAQATENRGALAQQRLGAYQNLVSNLAARGFGSGSGIGIQGASEIESGYLKSMGEAATNLTKFANTRQFGPTQGMFATPVSGAAETGMAKAGNLLDMAMGYNMMSKILRP